LEFNVPFQQKYAYIRVEFSDCSLSLKEERPFSILELFSPLPACHRCGTFHFCRNNVYREMEHR